MMEQIPEVAEWVGRTMDAQDRLDPFAARAMSALLDRPADLTEGDFLPHGWHWFYFRPVVARSALGEEGHAARGGFLPPIDLPRRMWAGGSLRFSAPLRLGERVTRLSEVVSVERKQGRTGSLAFVTVRHTVTNEAGIAVEEDHDIVYRGAPTSQETGRRLERPAEREWSERFVPDAVTLFHFSALTYNGHRIHYDHPYTTLEEGYPGLVVHAPLTALLLLDAAERWGGRPAREYRYRAVAPLFVDRPLTLEGRTLPGGADLEVWACDDTGAVAMQGRVAT